MIDDRAVEAAARAIALADGVEPDGEIFDAETGVVISPAWKYYETGARAALAAAAPFLTPQIPDGWKPIETAPTEERILLYVGEKGAGNPIAFGRVFDFGDARTVRAEGYHGDWDIRFWQPLPPSPSLMRGKR